MKHVAPLSVLAFLFLLYFVLPFVGQHSLDHLHADVPAAPNPLRVPDVHGCAGDVQRPRVHTHEHANKALALSARPTRCNVIGGGDGPGLPASRCVARPGFPQDKKTKDGTNKDAMTKDAMSKDRVKDDGMAKRTMRRRGVPLSSSIGE
jgi:pentapeptide MXKDX repeat protein